jgi:hypothetical protein
MIGLFPTIGKNVDKMNIFYEYGEDQIQFVFIDSTLGKEKEVCIYTAQENNCSTVDHVISAHQQMSNFVLEFTFPTKDFKDTISDAAEHGELIYIEKQGHHPLEIRFEKLHLNTCVEKYLNDDKIKLVCNLDDEEFFRCIVSVNVFKAIAGLVTNDSIKICCMYDNKILIVVNISDVVETFVVCGNL